MLRPQRHLIVSLLAVFSYPALLRADAPSKDLATQIEAVINGKDYKHAHWGLLAVDAKTGKTVYQHNPDKPVMPASTTQPHSPAAALGPNFRFLTPVYSRGELVGGRLKGDLILAASGDLTLGGRTTKDGHMAFKNHDHIYANSVLGRAELTDTDPLAGLNDLAKQV